jgi:hypothetical protein
MHMRRCPETSVRICQHGGFLRICGGCVNVAGMRMSRVHVACDGEHVRGGERAREKKKKKKSRQHSDFPGGHPPEYYPSLRLLNFAERTGYGVLSLRWPSTLLHPSHSLFSLTTLNNPNPEKRPFFGFGEQNLSGMPTCTLQCMSRHLG